MGARLSNPYYRLFCFVRAVIYDDDEDDDDDEFIDDRPPPPPLWCSRCDGGNGGGKCSWAAAAAAAAVEAASVGIPWKYFLVFSNMLLNPESIILLLQPVTETTVG